MVCPGITASLTSVYWSLTIFTPLTATPGEYNIGDSRRTRLAETSTMSDPHQRGFMSNANAQASSPLFKLSGELRNLIYAKVFQSTDSVESMHALMAPNPPECSLLLACQQLYIEANSRSVEAKKAYWHLSDQAVDRVCHITFICPPGYTFWLKEFVLVLDNGTFDAFALDASDADTTMCMHFIDGVIRLAVQRNGTARDVITLVYDFAWKYSFNFRPTLRALFVPQGDGEVEVEDGDDHDG
nr:hypothetical protein B0A51_12942 [Rachicladosporium sp. CCFEE 5018]